MKACRTGPCSASANLRSRPRAAFTLGLAATHGQAQTGRADPGAAFGYDLPGAGILLEGIGYDPQRETFYVSGVNDGGAHLSGPRSRGSARGTFLSDVAVGRDGAAYFTDSNRARIWRVAQGTGGAWQATLWLDGRPLAAGGAQGTTGRLWRIDLATKEISAVDLGTTSIVNADGIVLRGHRLWVVQNFSRQFTELALDGHWTQASLVSLTPTPANRTFTTAKIAKGRLLIVDSQFGFAPPFAAEDRVLVTQLP